MNVLKILRTEIVRMLYSMNTYIAMALIVLIYVMNGKTYHWQDINAVLYLNDELYFAAPTLLGIISASSFADDMQSGYYRPLCLRYGVNAYVRAKALSIILMPLLAALVCHVAVFMGMILCNIELQEEDIDIIQSSRYLGWALSYGQWWPYMLGGGLCLGMVSCLLISMAAYASVYISSHLFIWALPVILNMVCMISASYLRVPNRFNINRLIRGSIGGLEPCPTLWLLILLVLPAVLIMWAFVRAAKRRVLNA